MDYRKIPTRLKVKDINRTDSITNPDNKTIVYTPLKVVEDMLDLLPKELWSNSNIKFLDPCCKSGIFLERIFWRLNEGLQKSIPKFLERSDHILRKQLFAMAIRRDLAEISRGTLYGCYTANHRNAFTKQFDNAEGNIKVIERTAEGDINEYIRVVGTAGIFKITIEEAFENMKFDVIIGNPPYQENDGGGGDGKSAKPIYQKFIALAEELKPKYISFIIPFRWANGGRKELEVFKDNMMKSTSIRTMHVYRDAKDCFDVNLPGGICYYLKDRDYSGKCNIVCHYDNMQDASIVGINEFPLILKYGRGAEIIRKIKCAVNMCNSIDNNAFGLETNVRGDKNKTENSLYLHSSDGVSFINRRLITKGTNIIDKYKVIANKNVTSRRGVIFSTLKILQPGEICTRSYIVIKAFNEMSEAENAVSYMKTSTVRFLIDIALSGLTINSDAFLFVPLQDFGEIWTDLRLYDKYNLTQEEIDFIELMIKPMT